MRSILGNIHQGDKIFRNAGTQCTVIAYYALAFIHFSSTILDIYPRLMNAQSIDNILLEGNALYERSLISNNFENGHYFAHNELPNQVSVGFGSLETCVYPDLFFGVLGISQYEVGSGAISISEALNTGFQISNYMMCTLNDITVALFRLDNHCYIFDSHSRDMHGNINPFGSAVILEFECQDLLIQFISWTYQNNYFNLSPLLVTSITNRENRSSSFSCLYNGNYTEINNQFQSDRCERLDIAYLEDINDNTVADSNELIQDSNILTSYFKDFELFQQNITKIDSDIHLNTENTNEISFGTYSESVDHIYSIPPKKKVKKKVQL